jgi:hypothetical protein
MRELRQRLSKKDEVALGYTSEEVQSISSLGIVFT